MSTERRFWAVVDRLEETFMACALAFMTLITFVQVVLRYVFGESLVWSLEATTYTAAWLVLIGMSYGVRTKSHIVVDLVTSRLGERAARTVALFAFAACLIYCALMIAGSAAFVRRLFTLGNYARDIALPRWLLVGIMPVAFTLLAARLLQAGAVALRHAARTHEAPPP